MMSRDILERCARGEISPQIALSRLLLTGSPVDTTDLVQVAAAHPGSSQLAALARLAGRHRDSLERLGRLVRSGMWPSGADFLSATAALFDRLAAEAPEAGVAFYSFGDPTELAAATDELVGVIRAWSPVAGRRVLDFGCGIGRVAMALSDDAEAVLGLDISAGMIGEARRRADGRGGIAFRQSAGAEIPVEGGSIDLIVAADCLPYIVEAGLIPVFLDEAARVLPPGGDLLVFNWSYRGDPAQDVAEVHALAAAHGFSVLRAGERPFTIWDAAAFHLRRLP